MHNLPPARRGIPIIILACAFGLGACDGPHERAGREADKAVMTGQNETREGPNERRGEALDRVERADARATDAAADALEKRGDQIRIQADLDADILDTQARTMRKSTDRPAGP